jgi:hypothetical protein
MLSYAFQTLQSFRAAKAHFGPDLSSSLAIQHTLHRFERDLIVQLRDGDVE